MSRKLNGWTIVVVLSVLVLGACSNPVEQKDDHHDDIVGVEVTTMNGNPLATYAGGVWTVSGGDALHLHVGEDDDVRIFFLADDGDLIQLPISGADLTLRVVIEHPAIASFQADAADHGHFRGLAEGETTAIIQAYHGSHPDFETRPGLPIEVVDHDH